MKDLAIEAASKGSVPTLVFVVMVLCGVLVQLQQSPGPEDHRVLLETRVICPSVTELSKLKLMSAVRESTPSSAPKQVGGGLSGYTVFALASVLPLMPAAGLAKQGYEESLTSTSSSLRHPFISAVAGGATVRFAAVHAVGQAGTYLASQIARFVGTHPGQEFYNRCGAKSLKKTCNRAVAEDLATLRLVPPRPPPTATSTTTTAKTTLTRVSPQIYSNNRSKRNGNIPETTSAFNNIQIEYFDEYDFANQTLNSTQLDGNNNFYEAAYNTNTSNNTANTNTNTNTIEETQIELYSHGNDYSEFTEFDEFWGNVEDAFDAADPVLTLCRNARSSFADLYESLHEHPEFAPGSFAAALVSSAFGIYLLKNGNKVAAASASLARSTQRIYGQVYLGENATIVTSPRAKSFWTVLQAASFALSAVVVFILLLNYLTQTMRSGGDLLFSLSVGASTQLLVLLWSCFGKLFFDVRRCGDLALSKDPVQQDRNRRAAAAASATASTDITRIA